MTITAADAAVASRSADLVRRANDLFPGGVNSPVRAWRAIGAEPVVLAAGEGPWVIDADGRRYLDLVGAWGAAIVGHAHAAVVAAVRDAAGDGFALGMTHPREIELGEAIRAAMPSLERLRFTSSGTEAVMSALRVARAATGRDVVVVFDGAYHGHSDALLAAAGSGIATLGVPGSAGVPTAVASTTIVLPWNDPAAIDRAFLEHRGRIAAVVAEPVIANSGVIAPTAGWLEHLRRRTSDDGALLVFDEVITGFRLGRGGAQERFGIRPDLTTLGKIIGGGLPIGAYGGRADLMAQVAPDGPVYQAGTLSGHPLVMAAGCATLAELTPDRYTLLEGHATRLAEGLVAATRHASRKDVSVSRVGTLLTLFLRPVPPRDAAEARECDRDGYARLCRSMRDQGVLLPPSQFEAWFLGMAHGDAEVDRVLDAARVALRA